MSDDPLARPATPARVRAMAAAAALPEAALERALRVAAASPSSGEWQRFLSRALALLGAGLALAGVVCFFAYNWSRIGRLGKLGLLAMAIAAAALIGWRRRALVGQLALTAAAVLVGPLLGVYGQTYQTGADPYGLFLTWALLVAPWVVAACFAPLWAIGIAVLDVGLALWWTQAGAPGRFDGVVAGCVTIGVVHLVAVAAWEWQHRRPSAWLRERWLPRALAAVGLGALALAAGALVLDPDGSGDGLNVPGLLGLLALAAAIGAAVHHHRRVRPDSLMLTAAASAGLAVATIAIGRVLLVDLALEELGLLLVSLVVLGEIALGLHWLRRGRADDHEREA